MPYIGNTAADRFVASKAASVFSGDGSTTAFTLDHSVGSDEDILVSVDGVIQEPSVAYSVSGTTLTFTAAPSSNAGNNIFVYYLFRTVGTVSHPSSNALEATSGTFTGNLTVDTNTLKVDSTNNRVGIGTSSPSHIFHTSGTGQAAKFESSNNGLQVEFNYNNSTSRAFMGTFSNGLSLAPSSASTAINIDSNGHVTKPLQPAFLVRTGSGGSATNIPINGTTIVNFGTEVFDRGADFSTNTFTAPVTGLYQINFSGVFSQMDTASTYVELIIQCSNRNFNWTIDPDVFDQDAVYFPVNISCLADMDASDVAKIGITLPNDGTAQMDLVNYAYFSGYLVA